MGGVWFAVLMERSIGEHACQALFDICMRAGGKGFSRIAFPYTRVDLARNRLVEVFLSASKDPDDALVMLDADHSHPADTIERLVAHLKRDEVDVVGALAFRRGEPFDPCFFIRSPSGHLSQPLTWSQGLAKGTTVGTGAICIRRRTFDKLDAAGYKYPYFRYVYNEAMTVTQPSEDMYFGNICERAGIPHFCDMTLEIPHLIASHVDATSFEEYKAAHPEQFGDLMPRRQAEAPRVSVIIPSRGRKEQLYKCVKRLFETTKGYDVECIIVTEDHLEQFGFLPQGTQLVEHGGNAVEKWNAGLTRARGNWFVLGADDLWWGDDWLTEALRANRGGFVGFNDCHTDGRKYATHYMVSRDVTINLLGGVLAVPAYKSWYVDVEAAAKAQAAGVYVYAQSAVVEHRHPAWGTAVEDETIKRGEQWHEADRATFEKRRDAGFPIDYEPVLSNG